MRGKMERIGQLGRREQRGEFLPSGLMDGAAVSAAPSMSPGPLRCRLTTKTPGRRHVETEFENERGQRAALCRRWQKQAEASVAGTHNIQYLEIKPDSWDSGPVVFFLSRSSSHAGQRCQLTLVIHMCNCLEESTW